MSMATALPRHQMDYTLLVSMLAIIGIGLVILTSAGTVVGHEKFQDTYYFIKHQVLFGVLPGLVLGLLFLRIDYHWLERYAALIMGAGLVLLVAVLIPGVGVKLNTAARSWFVVGGYSVQPAEFAKLALIIFLSYYLSRRANALTQFETGFVPALIVGLVPVGLVVLQPDVGTASILFAIVFGMLFLSGARVAHLGMLAMLGAAAFIFLVFAQPYRTARLTIFLHPELYPLGIGYHVNQALLAVGSGGLTGLGLGHSRQKFDYLPEVQADSIFAVMSEEMGFLFVACFMTALLFLWLRGLRAARGAPDAFGRLLTGGIVIWLTVQSFLNIGAMVGLMPLTGVPLPLVSHGGSALITTMVAMAIVLNVSSYGRVVKVV